MHISFVTYNEKPELTADDEQLASYLRKKDISVSAAVWSDETINWAKFDVIVLRSMWDYHTKIAAFNLWLDKLEKLGCVVLNPVSVIKWNLNKKYLVDLFNAGKHVPPLQFCPQNSDANLPQLLKANNWSKAVVKPAVSGGSFNTWVVALSDVDLHEAKFGEMLKDGDVIVQKFMDEVPEHGELSLIFFNKIFSHAILKKAKQGDFRVQAQFGGTTEIISPNEALLQYTTSLLTDIEEPLLYARVDGILVNDSFYLMELELIEPVLFINGNETACEQFHRALVNLHASA
jgi:glutathione synthase/RimK-type ligase-like ATP-grasp enzyme